MTIPTDLIYTEAHTWVRQEGVDMRVGITHFSQDELGEVMFIELPEVGTEVEMNEPFGSVESEKSVSELYAPISGTVVEVNEHIEKNPSTINESPYDQGWMIVIEPSDDAELDELLSADQYESHISES